MFDEIIYIFLNTGFVYSLHHEDIPCWGETSRERAFSADVYCYVSARTRGCGFSANGTFPSPIRVFKGTGKNRNTRFDHRRALISVSVLFDREDKTTFIAFNESSSATPFAAVCPGFLPTER